MPNFLEIPYKELKIFLLPRGQELDEESYEPSLFPCEKLKLATMKSVKRRKEYVRRCYLFHQTYGKAALCTSDSGEPIWPDQLKGSVTHKSGHVAIVSSAREDIQGLGIDLESVQKMHPGLHSKICDNTELATLNASGPLELNESVAIVFSAKESIYKAIFPIGKKFFYFHHAKVMALGSEWVDLRLEIDTSELTPAGQKLRVHYQKMTLENEPYILTYAMI